MKRMGYVKRRCSNAGKVTVEDFEELKAVFLVDVKAEVLMNDIPIDLVVNWDQTGIQLIPTGEWTMHQAKDKIIPISHSDDKRQITGVFCSYCYCKVFLSTTDLQRKDCSLSPKAHYSTWMGYMAQ